MSLLDTFVVRDAVLQTVMQQDVHFAVRSDAPASGGSGTWDDPYYAAQPNPGNSSAINSSNAALFDGIMTNKVGPNQTVRLGPGTFCTKGSDGAGHQGWAAQSGMRILGSGISVTTLKLVDVPGSEQRHAIGMP